MISLRISDQITGDPKCIGTELIKRYTWIYTGALLYRNTFFGHYGGLTFLTVVYDTSSIDSTLCAIVSLCILFYYFVYGFRNSIIDMI